MKAKEIEKLIRRYVPARTLLGSNREKFIAELQELHQVGIQEQLNQGETLPIDSVSKVKRTACRCGKPYSEKDLEHGMCHKCCAPTTEY